MEAEAERCCDGVFCLRLPGPSLAPVADAVFVVVFLGGVRFSTGSAPL